MRNASQRTQAVRVPCLAIAEQSVRGPATAGYTASMAAIGAVTAPRGFLASGVHCGIRKKRSDLALVVSERPASAAAVFTTNLAQAAPVLVTRASLASSGGRARAIVVNAGNANACTGEEGMRAAHRTADRTAQLLGLERDEILVASTGVIGQRLPIEKLVAALPAAVRALSRTEGGARAAEAILTTDLRTKESLRTVGTPKGRYTVGGMAKGSGMIHPNMATTLAFVTTDAAIEPDRLRACLRRATEVSFNRISVDGDTSTNDMIAVLANGASRVAVTARNEARFEDCLTEVLTDLAKSVVRDGEGATKLITVEVSGAATDDDALRVSRTISGSPLVKTAVHGADANWGRIVAAAGRAGVQLDPEKLRVMIGDVVVLRPGYLCEFSEADAKAALERQEVTISVDLGLGRGFARTWTCDLTAQYVAINAGYRT